MANNRSRVFAFVLYPDNYEQMRLFDWLKEHLLSCKMLYILHQPESDEKKLHYHVMICFENSRTPDGVRKYFGVVKIVWRLSKMTLNAECKQVLRKPKKGEPEFLKGRFDTETGYKCFTAWKDKECFVLSNPEDPQSYIEVEYHDGEKVCTADCKLDEVWRLCPVYVVPHVEKVSDRCSYAAYLLHDTPQAIRDGKKRYEYTDIKGDLDFIESCFPLMNPECTSNLISDAMQIANYVTSQRRFIEECLSLGRTDILEYTASHSYFMERFVLPNFNPKGRSGGVEN